MYDVAKKAEDWEVGECSLCGLPYTRCDCPDDADECTCPRINVGMKVTENRNLSPHCPVHGSEHDRQADIFFGEGQ